MYFAGSEVKSMVAATSLAEAIGVYAQEEPVLPKVPFASCLDRWASTGEIDDYFSASLGRRTSGLHCTRLASFPPYLMVQLKRSLSPLSISPWQSRC